MSNTKKLYFTGPKVGQTLKVFGCNVVDGVVEVPDTEVNLINNLKRYYAMSEFDPQGLDEEAEAKAAEAKAQAKALEAKAKTEADAKAKDAAAKADADAKAKK